MADYNNPYEDGQEGWDQGYSDQQYLNQQYSGTNIPRTTYIDQTALTSLATNAGPSYPYLSPGSASHDDPGSYIPPHPGLATQPWDMGPYQVWTTSSLPPTTTYTMTSGAFSDPTATGFPDIAPLSDSLPPIPEQYVVRCSHFLCKIKTLTLNQTARGVPERLRLLLRPSSSSRTQLIPLPTQM